MKRQNKNSKKIASAASMLLLSTAMLGMATYAWFTMNKEVSVTGMKVKATAEQGLIISDSTKTNWATSKNVNMTASAVLAPTSTPKVATPTFVKNSSDFFDNAEADQDDGYEDLNLTWSTEEATSGSIGSVTASGATTNYALKRTFYIKSAGEQAWAQNLVIDEVTVAGTTNSVNLDKSLRVLVAVGTDSFIYAPVDGATLSYNWKGTTANATSVSAVASATDSTCTSVASIPITDSGAIKVEMYIYFEGEDANCKSSNISGVTVDDLTVSAKFKTADVTP